MIEARAILFAIGLLSCLALSYAHSGWWFVGVVWFMIMLRRELP
jgi:hypothetical protein